MHYFHHANRLDTGFAINKPIALATSTGHRSVDIKGLFSVTATSIVTQILLHHPTARDLTIMFWFR